MARQKATFIGVFLLFAMTGGAVGLKFQSDAGDGLASDNQVRAMIIRVERLDAAGNVAASQQVKLWIDSGNGRSRAEVREASGELQLLEVRRGHTFERLKTGNPPVYTSSTALPSSPRVWQGYVDRIFGPGERLSMGAVTKARSEQIAGRTASVIRGTVDEDGEPLTVEEIIDDQGGTTIEQRWFRPVPGGGEAQVESLRYNYLSDTQVVVSADLFKLSPPAGALTYEDVELRRSDVPGVSGVTVFGPAPSTGLRVEGISETRSSGPGIGSRHLVNLLYRTPGGSFVTVTNQSASEIAGLPRCEAPEAVVAGSAEDVVLEGNLACGYGTVIETPLGRGVLRRDSPTLEIQLGSTIVFVHASTPDEALALAPSLRVID